MARGVHAAGVAARRNSDRRRSVQKMTLYEIEIKESLSRTVLVKAESLDEAMSVVSDLYDERKIVLNALDCKDVEMRWRR